MKISPPAFPTYLAENMAHGLSMRDYFAASAIQALLTISPKDWHETYMNDDKYLPMMKGVPLIAYEFADAMMEARNA
jgi:hypothetical protein